MFLSIQKNQIFPRQNLPIIKFLTKSNLVPAAAARRPRIFLRRAAEASETRFPESSSRSASHVRS